MLKLCFKLPSCLFGDNRDMSFKHEKAKCVSFIYMQPQKVKFKSVQINMKQVSYYHILFKMVNTAFKTSCYSTRQVLTK